MKKYLTSPLFTPILFSLIWLSAMCYVFAFQYDNLPLLLSEKGILEQLTNFAYIPLLIAYIFSAQFFLKNKNHQIDFIVFVLLGISLFLRELGIQHWLTTHDTTAFKSRFFLNPNNPLSEKIVAGVILLAFFGLVVYLAVKYTKHLVLSFFQMNPTTWSIATLCTIGVLGKFFDRFPSNYKRSHGFPLPEQLRQHINIIEETSEILLPLITAFILFQYLLINKKTTN